MHGIGISAGDGSIRRRQCAGPAFAGNAVNVSAAHECMVLAHLHPEIWPVRLTARLTGWQSLRPFDWPCDPRGRRMMFRLAERATGTQKQAAPECDGEGRSEEAVTAASHSSDSLKTPLIRRRGDCYEKETPCCGDEQARRGFVFNNPPTEM